MEKAFLLNSFRVMRSRHPRPMQTCPAMWYKAHTLYVLQAIFPKFQFCPYQLLITPVYLLPFKFRMDYQVLFSFSFFLSAKVRIFMQGPHFFKYAALSPHKSQISMQNMRGLHEFIIHAFSLQKSHIYLSRKLKNVAFTSHESSHFPLLPWERYEVM